VLELETRQVDYTLAFVHAELDEDVYVDMPQMYRQEGKVLKLRKSVYGLRQSPLNWFKKLKGALEARGLKSCNLDPCLFISETCVCLVYVDDCLFFARKREDIEAVVDSLDRSKGGEFDLGYENSDVAGFLGIKLDRQPDGTIELKQPGLIARVINVMELNDSNRKFTPTTTDALGADKNGDPCEEAWSYSSVVGMMMYLASNSRPDIAFAVHQCARFTHAPKASHERALKRIGRYLLATKERGMVIRPSSELKLDCYADADFAGLYGYEDEQEPNSVKSRTGYIITLAKTPVLWVSKLQTEIALSTMEAEYIAVSQAMRDLLPLRGLMDVLATGLNIERTQLTKVSTVWEDNNGALALANKEAPMMTPRSKHIAIKYHWFRDKIKPGEIEVKRIATDEQAADVFTKGLTRLDFEAKRKLVTGW
jgi:hypothetical protein